MPKHSRTIAGKPVYDGRRKIELEITPDDVKNGARRSQSDCAAARSIQHCVPDAIGARVCLGRTYIEFVNRWEMYDTPNSLRSEVVAHDRDGKFEPGGYYLRPPTPSDIARRGKRMGSSKPGARDKGSKDRTPKKPRMKPHMVQGVRARGANV